MTPFFASVDAQQRLLASARAWEGTPFRVHNRARGPRGGVDCGNLIQELLLETGFITRRFDLPRPPIDYGQHHIASVVCRFLEETPELQSRFEKRVATIGSVGAQLLDGCNVTLPLPGDIVGVVVGKCVHHLVMILPGEEAIQALKPHGVTIFPLQEIRERIAVIYRPLSDAN